MLRLYIDRFPHEPVYAPRLIRNLNDLGTTNLDDSTALPQFLLPVSFIFKYSLTKRYFLYGRKYNFFLLLKSEKKNFLLRICIL